MPIEITKEQEKAIINSYLKEIQHRVDKFAPNIKLIKILQNLHQYNQLHIKIVDRDDPSEKLRNSYGYYSSYDNDIHLVLDKRFFKSGMFGLSTDYNNINIDDISVLRVIYTCIHELMHFTCNNRYTQYNDIWKEPFKKFITYFFNGIINNNFYDYLDASVINKYTPATFMKNPMFKEAFNRYYNSILINMQFRIKSTLKRYNDIMSTLYSKSDFEYARFFDNILVNALKLQEGVYTTQSYNIYNTLKNTYYLMEPTLKGAKLNSLHYQELFDLSEISCIFAAYYRFAPKYNKYVDKTLALLI